jgi:arylsulfatase A-like enzyme
MGDWKIVFNPREEEWELYNLADDLGERDNLVHLHGEKAEALVKEYERINQQMKEPIF